jgi:hypothetical protein
MFHNKSAITLAGGLTLMLVSSSCASQSYPRTATNPPPQDTVVASDRDDRTRYHRTAYDSPAGAMAPCTFRTDAKGNVIYDDPTCPSRYRQTRQQMGNSYENVQTKDNAFFDRYIDRAVKHAREAEIAGSTRPSNA